MNLYKIRAYISRAIGESGRVSPEYVSDSGSYATAVFVALELAREYGSAVIENRDTGNRVWHETA